MNSEKRNEQELADEAIKWMESGEHRSADADASKVHELGTAIASNGGCPWAGNRTRACVPCWLLILRIRQKSFRLQLLLQRKAQ